MAGKSAGQSAGSGSKASFIEEVHLYTDGGCRRNPGPGAIGVRILTAAGDELARHAECIGRRGRPKVTVAVESSQIRRGEPKNERWRAAG